MADTEEQPISINDLATRAEAFLFAEGGPIPRKELVSLLACPSEELDAILETLSTRLTGGVMLIRSGDEVSLAVAPVASEYVKKSIAKGLERDIGDAGLEVLAIILYRGPSTRAEIDYVRGVNTSSTVRTLIARGMLERIDNPRDSREYVYGPTIELLAHLGATSAEGIPEYATIHAELAAFETRQSSSEVHANQPSSHSTI